MGRASLEGRVSDVAERPKMALLAMAGGRVNRVPNGQVS